MAWLLAALLSGSAVYASVQIYRTFTEYESLVRALKAHIREKDDVIRTLIEHEVRTELERRRPSSDTLTVH